MTGQIVTPLSLIKKSCSNVECWTLQCHVGLLERGTTAILKVRSRVWAETFMERAYKQYVLECLARYSVEKMPYAILPKYAPSGQKKVVTPVVWNKPDIENSVPLWIIILAFSWTSPASSAHLHLIQVGFLQEIGSLRHRDGEGTAQTTGCIRGLKHLIVLYENHNTWPYDCNEEMDWKREKERVIAEDRRKERRETTGTPLCCTKQQSKDLQTK